MLLASKIAAHKARLLAATADPESAEISHQVAADGGTTVDQRRRPTIADRVRVAMGNDHDVACGKGDRGVTLELRYCASFGDQVVAHETLGAWCQHVRNILHVRYREPPRRGADRVEEDRASDAHRTQGFGQGIHR